MISDIRNPWIRKPLVVLAAPLAVALWLTTDILSAIEQYVMHGARKDWRLISDAWYGR